MLNREEVEIFNQPHQMYAEGKHDDEPSKSDIILLLMNEGYHTSNINIWYDSLMGLFLWSADIKEINDKIINVIRE